MLKHNQSATESTPAAQTRVKAEELARAVAAIEARRMKDAQGLGDTIAIGDAVRELNLDMTPDEIMREIQTEQKDWRSRFNTKTRRLTGFIGVGIACVAVAGWWAYPLNHSPDADAVPPISVTPRPFTITPTAPDPSQMLHADPNLLVLDRVSHIHTLQTLAEIPDGHPMSCSFDGSNFQSPFDGGNTWTLIKHDGKIYVRGWTEKMSMRARQQAGSTDIYSDNPQPGAGTVSYVHLTLPLSRFENWTTGQRQPGQYQISAIDVHLDKHAYEKW